MRMKLGVVLAIAVVAALALSTTSIGGGTRVPTSVSNKSALGGAGTLRSGHEVAAPSGAGASLVRGAALRYFETNPFGVAANGRDDSYMLCPRRFKAINGYFSTNGGIVEDNSYNGPALRRWNFGLIDLTGVNGVAYTGIVCLAGIGQ